jgi:hypothetical protein
MLFIGCRRVQINEKEEIRNILYPLLLRRHLCRYLHNCPGVRIVRLPGLSARKYFTAGTDHIVGTTSTTTTPSGHKYLTFAVCSGRLLTGMAYLIPSGPKIYARNLPRPLMLIYMMDMSDQRLISRLGKVY